MLYKLYSAVHRCPPCRLLVANLNQDFPEWKSYIEYIDADNMSEEQLTTARELKVFSLPTITNENETLFKGYNSTIVSKLKELCLTKE